MSEPTRGMLLADLADAINQLLEPRSHSEYVERTITDTVVRRNGKIRQRTRKVRVAHAVQFPGLLEALREAAVPGATDTAGSTGASFESRPPAELEPTSVLREIRDDTDRYARALNMPAKPSLEKTLRALVSSNPTDTQLANLAADARRWVRRARVATGFDAAPITLNQPCPYCGRRNSLVITADLNAGRCTACHTTWTPDTIGLLADMLTANQTQETAIDVRCWMADCTRRGVHDRHVDVRGRQWTDLDRCIGEDGRSVRSWTA